MIVGGFWPAMSIYRLSTVLVTRDLVLSVEGLSSIRPMLFCTLRLSWLPPGIATFSLLLEDCCMCYALRCDDLTLGGDALLVGEME